MAMEGMHSHHSLSDRPGGCSPGRDEPENVMHKNKNFQEGLSSHTEIVARKLDSTRISHLVAAS